MSRLRRRLRRNPVADTVSEPGNYGFVAAAKTDGVTGIPGGLVVGHFTDPDGTLIGLAAGP